MNIANCLTIFRIILVPFFVFFLSNSYSYDLRWMHCSFFAIFIFIIATITDALDGFLARKYNLVSTLGKFLDPLADKLLIVSAFICFLKLNLIDVWVVLIVIAREFLVILIRLIASSKNIVIAANFWGKLKTVSQYIACISTMIYIRNTTPALILYNEGFIIISTILTIISGFIYFLENKKIFKN